MRNDNVKVWHFCKKWEIDYPTWQLPYLEFFKTNTFEHHLFCAVNFVLLQKAATPESRTPNHSELDFTRLYTSVTHDCILVAMLVVLGWCR